MILNISPIYCSTDDLIDEYNALYSRLTDNNIDINNINSQVQINTKDMAEIHFRLASVQSELKFRNVNATKKEIDQPTPNILRRITDVSIIKEINDLNKKYNNIIAGRVKPPKNAQEMWSSYKYSVMARDVNLYKQIGKSLSVRKTREEFEEIAIILINELRKEPSKKGMRNTLEHMWGYISNASEINKSEIYKLSLKEFYEEIQQCVIKAKEPYLMKQTAISELGIWIDGLKE